MDRAILGRREFLLAGALSVAGCSGSARKAFWRPEEKQRLNGEGALEIVVRDQSRGGMLRSRARRVSENLELGDLARRMEQTMKSAGGVGIAGPQVGLSLRLALLLLDYKTDRPRTLFVINPVIVERSDESALGYEGCLSVPGFGGLVRRSVWLRVRYRDLAGQRQVAEAEGANAVLWQHELDHLDGVLFVDHLQGDLLPMEEVRRRRRLMEQGLSHRSGSSLEGLL